MNRVSKASVREVLTKYLSDELRDDIMNEIENARTEEEKSVVGMSVLDYLDRFDTPVEVVWAADSEGFGKAGDDVCGSLSNLKIFGIVGDNRGIVLLVWKDWVDWKDAKKLFLITPKIGIVKEYYATDWESAANAAIADGWEDFTVSRWFGKSFGHNDNLTERVGRVSCGKICKSFNGPIM